MARKAIAASLIAENVTVNGDLASDGDVQLDGTVRGDLRVGRLTIGESGQVEGAIEAEAVDIRGRVTGSIVAQTVRLHASAQVIGDVIHTQLAIDAGARFEGRSLRFEAPAPAMAALEAPAAMEAAE
ncbi:polymer-forming cytoskeletal protein [Phenylobacterium sp. J367]|uniref:bactofilin family protein n=1 Tax=Phenylobacterium sp. J367 TaxID=2898435 RepID=UPI002150BBC7|nr:polymer-forming cytoskeletal protein [Phenylobacterium sp. J367]MCR5880586.1 polymer-forming cytoskeletal protein [Phenylobacterium sp. J367]